MRAYEQYLNNAADTINKIKTEEKNAIESAADLIFNSLSTGGYLYTFGTGHGHILAEEIFYRAGGLVRVKPMLDENLMLHVSATRSTDLERTAENAASIMEKYNPQNGDIMIIASNSGRNELPVEIAGLASERGVKTICITNLTQSENAKSRHKSGKKLYEVCDIVIDNHGVEGDACINIGSNAVSPLSTVSGAAILQAIIAEAAAISYEKGTPLEIFSSSNIDGGDEKNEKYIQKYRGAIISL